MEKQLILPEAETPRLLFPFFLPSQMAIIGSRCHLAGEDSLSSRNALVRGTFSLNPCLKKLHHALPAPSPLFQRSPPWLPILSFPKILKVSLWARLRVQIKVKRRHREKKKMRNLSLSVSLACTLSGVRYTSAVRTCSLKTSRW